MTKHLKSISHTFSPLFLQTQPLKKKKNEGKSIIEFFLTKHGTVKINCWYFIQFSTLSYSMFSFEVCYKNTHL